MHGDVILAQPLGMDRKGVEKVASFVFLNPETAKLLGAILLSQVWDLWYLTIAV